MLSNFAIFLYLIASIFFGRRNPYFYLIFPFAVLQGPSAFISQDIMIGNKLILSNTSTIFGETLLTFLLIVILVTKSKKTVYRRPLVIYFLYIYLAYVILLLLFSILSSSETSEVLLTVRPFIYIVLGYFIWVRIWSSGTRAQLNQFIKVIMIATLVVDILYILNSSQIFETFENTNVYATITIGRETIYRDFKSIPVFGLFAFSVSLIMISRRLKEVPQWILIANIVIFPFVVLFTFTRSYLISVLLHVAFVFLINNLIHKQKLINQIMRNILLAMLLFLIWFASERIFSTEFSYFKGRIEEVAIKKMEVDNLSVRFDYIHAAWDILDHKDKALTGEGFIRDSYPKLERIGSFAADSTITMLFIHTGWIGTVLIYMVWFGFTIMSLQHFFKTRDWLLQAIAAYGFSTIIVSSLMGTDIRGGILSLMYFAMAIVVKYGLWTKPETTSPYVFTLYG